MAAQIAVRSSASPTILVMDSDVLVRLAVADYLRGCGFKVYEAGGADEVMQIVRSRHKAAVAFLDLGSPDDGEGFTLAQWIRENKPTMKVILTSGAARTAKEAGHLCSEGPIMRKPYDHQLLERYIRKVLAQGK
jgi:DNA-binding NtrC family response regulator